MECKQSAVCDFWKDILRGGDSVRWALCPFPSPTFLIPVSWNTCSLNFNNYLEQSGDLQGGNSRVDKSKDKTRLGFLSIHTRPKIPTSHCFYIREQLSSTIN